jgi:hypothetical protein
MEVGCRGCGVVHYGSFGWLVETSYRYEVFGAGCAFHTHTSIITDIGVVVKCALCSWLWQMVWWVEVLGNMIVPENVLGGGSWRSPRDAGFGVIVCGCSVYAGWGALHCENT